MRLLVWLVLGLIVYFALRSKVRLMQENLRKSAQQEFAPQNQEPSRQRSAQPAENMVACAHCHLYLPSSEAVRLSSSTSEQFFCSEEHLRIHSSQRPTSETGAE